MVHHEQLVKSKPPFTARESFVAKMGRKVLQHRSSASSSPACVVYVDSLRSPIALPEFVNVASLVCRTICPLDGHIIEFPLLAWREQRHYLQYTLVLYGDSSLGKTQLATSLLASIAGDIWQTPDSRCYFLKIETIEGLREAVGANAIKRGVGILYDDIEPSKVRGTRAGSSLDDVKNLTEVGTSSTLHARFRDIVLEELQQQIFTTNASHPGEGLSLIQS